MVGFALCIDNRTAQRARDLFDFATKTCVINKNHVKAREAAAEAVDFRC